MTNTTDRIVLKTASGTYIADATEARAYAAQRTVRDLRRTVRDYWPELWRETYWRTWVNGLSRLELAVIIKQR